MTMDWINLKKEKPDVGVAVLVYMKGRGTLVGILMNVDKTPLRKWWAIFSTGAHPIDQPELITHWMYLPEPPNEI